MAALLSLLVIIALSYLIVHAGAVALTLTGLSADSAVFQSQSAFMGVGFTTSESESVVNHPARRRVIRILMLCGFLSLGSGLAGVLTAFGKESEQAWQLRLGVLAGGLVILWLISRLSFVRSGITRLFEALLAGMGQVRIHDYDELLKVDKGFAISSILVEPDNWMTGQTLRQMRLMDEGVIVLNLVRGPDKVVTTPGPEMEIEAGDRILLYGLQENLAALANRGRFEGKQEHRTEAKRTEARRVIEESQ